MNQLTDDQLMAIAKNPEEGARFIKENYPHLFEDKIKIGTLCIVWDDFFEDAKIRYYAGNNECFIDGNKFGSTNAWTNIVPIQAMEGFNLPE